MPSPDTVSCVISVAETKWLTKQLEGGNVYVAPGHSPSQQGRSRQGQREMNTRMCSAGIAFSVLI